MMAWFSFVANHLWQSTVFAFVSWLLTLVLRKNRAAVRYGIWFAASLKFLLPFSVLVWFGGWIGSAIVPVAVMPVPDVIQQVSEPFAWPEFEARGGVAPLADQSVKPMLPTAIAIVWFCGSVTILALTLRRWRRVAKALRFAESTGNSRELQALRRCFQRASSNATRIRVVSSNAAFEPGVVGILRPVLVLPATIASRLDDAQMDAIIARELGHVRRHDNLTAALHMMVESIFWFHPLVWWLGARLVDERERACDEEVVRLGNDPHIYAEGILQVCKSYVESPVVCAAGITGANLKRRIEEIMTNTVRYSLGYARRALLIAAGFVSITGPVVFGFLNARQIHAQGAKAAAAPAFEVASIKPSSADRVKPSMIVNPGGIIYSRVTLGDCIQAAFGLQSYQITGPDWIKQDQFEISARSATTASREELMRMLQTLLADRFKLAFHRTQKEMQVYSLSLGKGELKLRPSKEDGPSATKMIPGGLSMAHAAISDLLAMVKGVLGSPVTDSTGLTGRYDFDLMILDTEETAPDKIKMAMVQGGPDVWAAAVARLGLRLDNKKMPADMLVIDHAEKPSENPAGADSNPR